MQLKPLAIMSVLLLAGLLYMLSPGSSEASIPLAEKSGEIITPPPPSGTFGPWASDPETLVGIQQALKHGRAVVISNALKPTLARGIAAELKAAVRRRKVWEVGGTEQEDEHIPAETFDAAPNKQCASVHAFSKTGFKFRTHRWRIEEPRNRAKAPSLMETIDNLQSSVMRSWIREFLGRVLVPLPVPSFLPNVFWFRGDDYFGMHNDDVGSQQHGVQRILSFTFYPGPGGQDGNPASWDAKWGGNLVWCRTACNQTSKASKAPSTVTEPAAFAPEANTLVLFRVDDCTHHFVSRVNQTKIMAKRAPRLSVQGWWEMEVPNTRKARSRWRKDFYRHTSILPPLRIAAIQSDSDHNEL